MDPPSLCTTVELYQCRFQPLMCGTSLSFTAYCGGDGDNIYSIRAKEVGGELPARAGAM